MATSNNLMLKMMSGHLGKQLVIRQYGDKTVVSKYPDMSRRKLSKKQKQVNKIMAEANYYAKEIIANDKLKKEALLRLNITRNKLYTALIKEYFQEQKMKTEGKK
jgi:disulfide oxidoreductase YuzD